MNKRSGIIDLWRFIGSLVIMAFHIQLVGGISNDYHFRGGVYLC